MKTICALVLLAIPTAMSECRGAIVRFMPGEAFFSSRLTEDSLAELKQSQDGVRFVRWRGSPILSGGLGGFAGFSRLALAGMTQDDVDRLQRLYIRLRHDYPKEVVIETDERGAVVTQEELNGFHLLVYNRSFDPVTFRIGLKYNERWMSLPESAVGPPHTGSFFRGVPAVVYYPFVRGSDAIIADWKDAANVEPLKVKAPEGVFWARTGPENDAAVAGDFADLQFIIVADGELDYVFEQKPAAEFWRVQGSEIHRFWREDHQWHSEPITETEETDNRP